MVRPVKPTMALSGTKDIDRAEVGAEMGKRVMGGARTGSGLGIVVIRAGVAAFCTAGASARLRLRHITNASDPMTTHNPAKAANLTTSVFVASDLSVKLAFAGASLPMLAASVLAASKDGVSVSGVTETSVLLSTAEVGRERGATFPPALGCRITGAGVGSTIGGVAGGDVASTGGTEEGNVGAGGVSNLKSRNSGGVLSKASCPRTTEPSPIGKNEAVKNTQSLKALKDLGIAIAPRTRLLGVNQK